MIAAGGGSMDKARCIVDSFPDIWSGTVLDVGCRSRELERALAGRAAEYIGLDIQPPADIIADLDAGIPMGEGEADVVVALDVLEHTDGIHTAFAELCRVAGRWVVISLPNAYDFAARVNHLLGRPVSGKYGLPPEAPVDRHHWFFSMDEARVFCRTNAGRAGWRVADEGFILGPRRGRVSGLVSRMPNLLSSTYVATLNRL
jgi:hypothetical protein